MDQAEASRFWAVILGSVGFALGLAAAFVLIIVVAPTTPDDLPVSASWIFGFALGIPLALVMCLLSAVGALAGSYGVRNTTLGAAGGSIVGGGLGVALVAGVGFSLPPVLLFAIGAVVQTLILTFVYRSAPSPRTRR